jgi:hypothetical protein
LVRRAAEAALVAVVLAALAAISAPAANALPQPVWAKRVQAAEHYARGRAGLVSFALIDERGRWHGYRARAVVPTASLLKAMLLVAYLRMGSVRDRDLTAEERGLLGPLIRWSDNAAVATVLPRIGSRRLNRLARAAHMERFRLAWPVWGLSETTARDQSGLFHRIDALVPAHHRRYALSLLRRIIPAQRWGVAEVPHEGWRLYFKGGWGSGTGLVDHQSALLVAGHSRVSLSVTTRFNPDHEYGKATLRGVARRLVGRLPVPFSSGAYLPR